MNDVSEVHFGNITPNSTNSQENQLNAIFPTVNTQLSNETTTHVNHKQTYNTTQLSHSEIQKGLSLQKTEISNMGKLLDTLMGNVGEVSPEEIAKHYQPLLVDGEHIERAFAMIRYKWIFTNLRLIMQDTQGLTGKKKEFLSIPYRAISHFSVETPGTFDMDSELKIWLHGHNEPIQQDFKRGSNILDVQRTLAKHVLCL